ncbi:MAG: acyl-CoA thioesterase [Acidobacteria bacterium]|nr:MAG: acyl-CoA thioesterase [Acidobacteriota bacterium]REK04428.1 MAG: acyl-CoA thioesterase [Acidobacteriota bacterium]
MAGIIHFSRYYVFMERAEHEFWNALGTSVHTEVDGVAIGWPRLEASCRFLRPVRFEDVLDIHLQVVRKGGRSLTFEIDFWCRGERVAQGRLATCCCALTPGEPPRAVPIPAVLAERIEERPTAGDAPYPQ